MILRTKTEEVCYAEALRIAKVNVNLIAIAIDRKIVNYTASEALLIKIAGTGKADILTEHLREELKDSIRISRPMKRAETMALSIEE